jgi:hypothetical protein
MQNFRTLSDWQYAVHQSTEETVTTPLAKAYTAAEEAFNGVRDLAAIVEADRAAALDKIDSFKSLLGQLSYELRRAKLAGPVPPRPAADDDPDAWIFQ